MDLTLYRVIGGMKRVALGDLADGVEFFTAAKDEATKVITLTPVNIVTGFARSAADEAEAEAERQEMHGAQG